MYEMFYELFKDSEYRDLDMFKQYIDKRRTEKEKEANKKKGTKEEGIDEDITKDEEEGSDEDITKDEEEGIYEEIIRVKREFQLYMETFNNYLYEYKVNQRGEAKKGYCLGDDNCLPELEKTISTVMSEKKEGNDIKSKDEFKKVENGQFSCNVIDYSILSIIYYNYSMKEGTRRILTNLFNYFGLDYSKLQEYKRGAKNKKLVIRQKWIGMFVFLVHKSISDESFTLSEDNVNELLCKYQFLEDNVLLCIIDYVIDNYSEVFIKDMVDKLNKYTEDLLSVVDSAMEEFLSWEKSIDNKMTEIVGDLDKYMMYSSYLHQLRVYKRFAYYIIETIHDENFYEQIDVIEAFLGEESNNMNTMTKILMNQLIVVKFLTKIYDRINKAVIYFQNSIDSVNE